MSRRARKGKSNQNFNPVPILIGMAIAIVAVIAIVFVLKIVRPQGPTSSVLPYEDYTQNSKSMVGNTYTITGTIKSSEVLPDSKDTKLVIMPDNATRDTKPIAIFVKKEIRDTLQNLNLEIASSYVFTVEVSNRTFLEATSIRSK